METTLKTSTEATESSREREKVNALRWAIGFSTLLFGVKGAAAIFCSSQALLASALDSLMDVGISSVNFLSVRKAAQPADEEHAYGHEKIESLASYSQGILILIFAFLLFAESVRRTLAGNLVSHSAVALITIGFAALVNFLITAILQRAERKTQSLILKAEKTHYFMDILSYLVIFTALVLLRLTGWPGWDIVGGIFVGGYVAFLAVRISLQAANELVDRSLPKSRLDELDTLIKNHDSRILGFHEMRTRKAGRKVFLDFHLVFRPEQSFHEAHEVTESLIQKIRSRFPNADITIHEDPEGGP